MRDLKIQYWLSFVGVVWNKEAEKKKNTAVLRITYIERVEPIKK